MPENTDEPELAKDAYFELNEPSKEIPGGPQRESIMADLTDRPQIQRRLRLNRLLLIHDPEVAEESLAQIEEEDLPVLRRMAQESVLSGNEPILRRNAISVLSRYPTPENLNLLTELARFGGDPYVRGAAMTALANTRIIMALPLLKEGLAAQDPIEYRRAQQGLILMGSEFGTGRIRDLLKRERRKRIRNRITEVLEALAEPMREPEARVVPQVTAEDETR